MNQPKSAKKINEEEKINIFLSCFPEGYASVLKENNAYVRCKQGVLCVFCESCKKTFKSSQETIKHINSKEHSIIRDTKHFLSLMRHIPSISESHRTTLNNELSSVDGEFIDEGEVKRRNEIFEQYSRAIESRIPGLKMHEYGSLAMGFAQFPSLLLCNVTYISTSSENVEAEEEAVLSKIFYIICEREECQGLPSFPKSEGIHFTGDVVRCLNIDDRGTVSMRISMGNPHGVDLASLIRTYCAIDSRAKRLIQLLIVFSRMAHLTEVLPLPAMCVMVIFFLQRLSPPLLPNLHEIVQKYQENFSINCVTKVVSNSGELSYLSDLTVLPKFFATSDSFTLGDLWLKFLRFYVCEFQRRDYLVSIVSSEPVKKSARKVKSQTLFVENPICPGTSLFRDMTVFMDRFIHEQFLAAYVYFGIPRLKGASMPLFTDCDLELSKSLKRTFCLGTDGNNKFPLFSVPAAEVKSRVEKALVLPAVSKGGKLVDIVVEVLHLAISEICSPECKIDVKKSFRRTPRSMLPSLYSMDSLLDASQAAEFARTCCKNYWIAVQNDLKEGASKVQLLVLGREVVQKALENMTINTTGVEKKAEAGDDTSSLENADPGGHSSPPKEPDEKNGGEGESDNEDEEDTNLNDAPADEEAAQSGNQKPTWSKCINTENQYKYIVWDSENPNFYNSAVVGKLKSEDLAFPFKADKPSPRHFIGSSIIAHSEAPPMGCSQCASSGHLTPDCPATNLQYWKNLEANVPIVTDEQHLSELSESFLQLAEYHKLPPEMAAQQQNVVESLTALFKQTYPDVSLALFGSCANGFETKTSDMDICVVFPKDTFNHWVWYGGTNIQRQELLKNFKKILSRKANSLRISNIRPVFHAKVPIIKFLFDKVIEVDLSFSNFLAIHNTRLLRLYNDLEPRLRVLNTVLKVVLKACGIPKSCDGGISSYAYAIMLIHYLQRKGYLPCLQEAHEEKHRPRVMILDDNIWFQEDRQIILKHWQPPKDNATVAELWLGFLRYYLFEFNRNTYTVTIDRTALALRTSDLACRITNSLAVKDPFELSHNMTQFVHEKLMIQIFTTFYNVLLHHSTAFRRGMNSDLWKQSLFCSPKLLQNLHDSPHHENHLQRPQGRKRKNKMTIAATTTAAVAAAKPAVPAKPVPGASLLGSLFVPPPKLTPVLTQVAGQGNRSRGRGGHANHVNMNGLQVNRMNHHHPQPLNSHNQPVGLPAFAQQVHVAPVQAAPRNPMNPPLVVGVPHQNGGRGGGGGAGRGGGKSQRGGRKVRHPGRGFSVGISRPSERMN